MAWTWQHLKQWHVTNAEERARDLAWDGVKVEPLYRYAQQPVVRPAPECEHQWRHGGANKLQNQKQCIKCGRVELDAQPAPVVPDAYVRDERGRMMLNGVCEPKIGFGAGWNACRAAMLQGADGKPELTVWYGAMPETNGKTNWTAILHREGQHPREGITIDRSEYPDRVRYEADRMRHLIGELADEPDILAYDAEAHSGYVYPGNSPVIPGAEQRISDAVDLLKKAAPAMLADNGGPDGPLAGRMNSPVIPEGSASMFRRWLAFGRGMQNAGCQLPHNLIAETESMLAAAAQPQNAPQNIPEIIPGWIPVSERMPEAGGDMIVFTDGIVMSGISYAKKKGFYIQALEYDNDEPVDSVTHWMPLPAGPKEEK